MATNYKNTGIISISTDTTFPAYVAGTGTITAAAASRDVSGASTLFTTELHNGDWIVDITNHEIRKITAIGSATALNIDHGFTNAQTTVDLKSIPSSRVVKIDAYTVSGGKIDTVTLPAAQVWPVADKSSRETQHSPIDFCDPIFVDGTGGTVIISYEL